MKRTDNHSTAHVVALLFRRVGDSLLATPALRAVKRHSPDTSLIVLCERQVARIFAHNPSISNIVEVNPSASFFELASVLRRTEPSIILDFLSLPHSGLASLCSGAHRRIGIAGRGRSWMYTGVVDKQNADHPIYSAVHKLALAAAVGANDRDTTTEFHLTDNDRAFAESTWRERNWNRATRVAAFFVHSRREYKNWPLEKFRGVIRWLLDEHSIQPLLLATPGAESAVTELREHAGLTQLHTMTLADLGHLGSVLERCFVLIGNDGGPKHLAVAVGTPTVTVFMHDSPVFWTPPNDPRHIIFTSNASPDDVYNAACSAVKTKADVR